MDGQLTRLPESSVGIGLRSVHIDHILQNRPNVPWFEILMDNHMAHGGLIPEQLAAVRQYYPITLHCVGLSPCGQDPLDMSYLHALKWMIDEYQPVHVSDHLCFTHFGKHQFNDLLPIPFTNEALHHVCGRINKIQEYLGHKILIENVSSYVQFSASEMNEAEFLTELATKTGCGILLDINNVYVNEFNHGYNAKDFIDNIPVKHIGEVHLAGFEDKKDYLIDAHNNPVSEAVWALFEYYIKQETCAPVLIEWDNDIPAFSVLLGEAEKAKSIIINKNNNTRLDNINQRATC